jgi:hypothetical protein
MAFPCRLPAAFYGWVKRLALVSAIIVLATIAFAILALVSAIVVPLFSPLGPIESVIVMMIGIILFGKNLPDVGRWIGRRFSS